MDLLDGDRQFNVAFREGGRRGDADAVGVGGDAPAGRQAHATLAQGHALRQLERIQRLGGGGLLKVDRVGLLQFLFPIADGALVDNVQAQRGRERLALGGGHLHGDVLVAGTKSSRGLRANHGEGAVVVTEVPVEDRVRRRCDGVTRLQLQAFDHCFLLVPEVGGVEATVEGVCGCLRGIACRRLLRRRGSRRRSRLRRWLFRRSGRGRSGLLRGWGLGRRFLGRWGLGGRLLRRWLLRRWAGVGRLGERVSIGLLIHDVDLQRGVEGRAVGLGYLDRNVLVALPEGDRSLWTDENQVAAAGAEAPFIAGEKECRCFDLVAGLKHKPFHDCFVDVPEVSGGVGGVERAGVDSCRHRGDADGGYEWRHQRQGERARRDGYASGTYSFCHGGSLGLGDNADSWVFPRDVSQNVRKVLHMRNKCGIAIWE